MRLKLKFVKALLLVLITCVSVLLFIVPGRSAGGPLIISEYRLRGPNGANDEFIEIYNNSDDVVNVLALDGSAGYAVVASDGITRFFIPNGTIIPARGHFLAECRDLSSEAVVDTERDERWITASRRAWSGCGGEGVL